MMRRASVTANLANLSLDNAFSFCYNGENKISGGYRDDFYERICTGEYRR